MKYLDFLTKEELIEVVKKALPEDEQYKIVYEAMEKQSYFAMKELNSLEEQAKKLDIVKLGKKRYDEESYEIRKKMLSITDRIIEISKKSTEVIYMMHHKKRYPEDNRDYEVIMKEKEDERKKETEEWLKTHLEEMEKKYG